MSILHFILVFASLMQTSMQLIGPQPQVQFMIYRNILNLDLVIFTGRARLVVQKPVKKYFFNWRKKHFRKNRFLTLVDQPNTQLVFFLYINDAYSRKRTAEEFPAHCLSPHRRV